MVTAFGFTNELGTVGWKDKKVSPHIENQIDDQVRMLASNAYVATISLLK